jgi:hypothetical protein
VISVNQAAPLNARLAIRSSRRFGSVDVPTLYSHQWPLSFWKEVRRQYPCKWRAPDFIVGPTAGYVNSPIIERMNEQVGKRNSLLDLDFIRMCGTAWL